MMSTEVETRTETATLVVPLVGERHAIALVGAKAAPLARAAAHGHAVPVGVVVTTAAAGAAITAVVRQIEAALPDHDGVRYAVRSSAVGEDGKVRSFAGQLETDLGVQRSGLGAAIERCWASASALRALRYGGGTIGEVAVIVQEMVDADAAGVAFSADPRTGERGVAIVEAVRGLGDQLVSGATDPEAWRVRGGSCVPTRTGERSAPDGDVHVVVVVGGGSAAVICAPRALNISHPRIAVPATRRTPGFRSFRVLRCWPAVLRWWPATLRWPSPVPR